MDTLTSPTEVVNRPRPTRRAGTSVTRRQATLWATGLLLVIGGALASVALVRAGDERDRVLIAATDLPAGARVTDGDVRVAEVAADGLDLLAEAEQPIVVGSYTKVRVLAGQPFTSGVLQSEPLVTPGKVVVAIPVTPVQLPANLREQSLVDLIPTLESPTGGAATMAAPHVRAVVIEYPAFGADAAANTVAALSVEVDPADADVIVAAGRDVAIVLVDPVGESGG